MSGTQEKLYEANHYGALPDGMTLCTTFIQQAIDEAASAGGGCVAFAAGVYLTGALFLKSNVELRLDEGVELRGVVSEDDYPELWSRIAGVEMNWHSGLINVCGQQHVSITGKGTINGQGNYWWDKYWSMRKAYTEQGLRWAVDYDCKRPRNVLVTNSSHVLIQGVTLVRSPFWNVHVCYSEQVTIDGLTIYDNQGPSTDGIDIDSCSHVLVENCRIDCNDDNLCIKSGRDADGLRVNRPAEHIVIRNCVTGAGAGITLGSETSGGIHDVEIYNIKAVGTDNGLRFKSARTRGGLIENIRVHDLEMIDVPHPFSFQLNWNPSYSYCEMPEGWHNEIPAHWRVLAEPVVPQERGIPEFRNVTIENVTVTNNLTQTEGKRLSEAFQVEGLPEKPISDIRWRNISIEADSAGAIAHAKNWTMSQVTVRTPSDKPLQMDHCQRVEQPVITVVDAAGAHKR